MHKNKNGFFLLLSVFCGLLLLGGCDDRMGTAGGKAGGEAEITREAIDSHLAEFGLNVPGLAPRIALSMRKGEKFRDRVKDKNGKYTTLTAWVDRKSRDVFCILFYRDEKCPECGGTGEKKMPSFMDTRIAGIVRTCPKCKGTGFIKNQKHQRCWVLASDEHTAGSGFDQPQNQLKNAPAGADKYVGMLGSTDPQERLDACVWLSKNYIRPGLNFLDIMPIIERARYSGPVTDNSLLTKIMGKRIGEGMNVYQYWAGKGIQKEWRREYWRIYIENKSGKVVKTEFAPGRPPKRIRKRRK